MSEHGLEAETDDLYEDAPCALLSTTMDGTIVRANRTLLAWTGYSLGELVGSKRFVDLLTTADRIYHETHYVPLLRMQGHAREIALEIQGADGARIPTLIAAVVRPGENGNPDVVRIAVFRAEDRREYERELLRARRRAEESEQRARTLAETLQASLMPPTPPQIPGLDLGAAYRPAGSGEEVGGDFYDVFEIAPGNWAVMIGDARGKGAEAAMVTALARYTVRAAAVHEPHPANILQLLNDAMLRQTTDTFMTVGYAGVVLEEGGGATVTLVAGGHPLPVLVSADGAVRTVGEPGTVIGVLDDPSLTERTITLGHGDVLALFTDGVTEGRRADDFFGEIRLAGVLGEARAESAATIADRLVDAVVGFQEGQPRDDIAVVILKVSP